MFLPIGDSPNPPGTPWVNYTIIAINIAVYLLLLPQTRAVAPFEVLLFVLSVVLFRSYVVTQIGFLNRAFVGFVVSRQTGKAE